ncbi:MAG TPA: hypothetical protein VHO07_01810 [Streptosporangiaceae bacterium]|nr:hypothetical protein [Streptosporangiaceae bacterium]
MERDGVRQRARPGCFRAAFAVLAVSCCAGLLAGCSSAKATSGPGVAGVGATCGTAFTAVNVPVIIKVAKGTVDCGTALHVEDEYAAKIRNGQVQGNGGGAPVTVNGWTCQGYATPVVLSTGNASQCHTSSATILAVLAVPTPTTTAA